MRRFTSIELGGLFLAAFLFLGGLSCVLWPRAGVVVNFTNDVISWPGSIMEKVSATSSRIYGILAMLLGLGIAALAAYRGKDET